MKIQFFLLSTVAILFTKVATAQIYPPEPEDFKLATSFEFVVEKQSMQPGSYIMRKEKASNRLQICEDGVTCTMAETTAVHAAEAQTLPTLVFHRYGNKHFLSQIWFPDGTGLQLPISPLELEGARSETNLQAVYVQADLMCIHAGKGLAPSWH
jgi:hypothetical protein